MVKSAKPEDDDDEDLEITGMKKSSPALIQQAIDEAPGIVHQFFTELGCKTGWCWSAIGVGPSPVEGGKIRSFSVHIGLNKHGLTFSQSTPKFRTVMVPLFGAFADDAFPPEIQLQRVLPSVPQAQSSSIPLVSVDISGQYPPIRSAVPPRTTEPATHLQVPSILTPSSDMLTGVRAINPSPLNSMAQTGTNGLPLDIVGGVAPPLLFTIRNLIPIHTPHAESGYHRDAVHNDCDSPPEPESSPTSSFTAVNDSTTAPSSRMSAVQGSPSLEENRTATLEQGMPSPEERMTSPTETSVSQQLPEQSPATLSSQRSVPAVTPELEPPVPNEENSSPQTPLVQTPGPTEAASRTLEPEMPPAPPPTSPVDSSAIIPKPTSIAEARPKRVIKAPKRPDATPSPTKVTRAASNPTSEAGLWLKSAQDYLSMEHLGAEWMECVQLWWLFKSKFPPSYVGCLPSSKSRPHVLSAWINARRKLEMIPEIPDPAAFGAEWLTWWMAIQPTWRKSAGTTLPVPVNTREDHGAL
ncbi:hypothetical protein A0H81_03916 [Grifola frondosa]|uniref:Uncharacterized protein n=1 Tax=Grifola frondosa TaxID=5627 RepID=A0A1C7MIG0_GRIFR|nr:hypothetical protein A0H81_03916 [Grifola frondosa]